jgi:general secretion pathway protein D
VEYKDAGVILTVTPRIGERGTVALDIKQEVNDVGAQEPPTFSRRFRKREVETSAVLTNNQTLALGGLIQNKRTLTRSGIPLLNRIPLLGLLFGSTEEKIEKTELLILITPRVLGTALDAARITEEMKRITPGIRDAVKQAPRPPSRPPRPPEPSSQPAPEPPSSR